MKAVIISHSPLWKTGFGVTCNIIASSMVDMGIAITCLGIVEPWDISTYQVKQSFTIKSTPWSLVKESIIEICKNDSPDIFFINYDIEATAYFINLCRSAGWKKKIFAHVVIDGFPISEQVLNQLQNIDGIVVPTLSSLKYLESKGLSNLNYAPHGVNSALFFQIKNKAMLRLKLGLKETKKRKFLIGVFAKNEERKQIPKILLALQYLIYVLKQTDIFIYLHTQAHRSYNRGTDLEFIVSHLNLNDYVIFPPKEFQQEKGVEGCLTGENALEKEPQLSYTERINACDLVINIPFSGGFELCNIEAQACGIPLITIDDYGNIKELYKDSALLIKANNKNIGANGSYIYLVDEIKLAQKILYVKNNPRLKESLILKGIQNAKKHQWSQLEDVVKNLLS